MVVGGTPKYIPISDRKEGPRDLTTLDNKRPTQDIIEKRIVNVKPNSYIIPNKADSNKGSEAV